MVPEEKQGAKAAAAMHLSSEQTRTHGEPA